MTKSEFIQKLLEERSRWDEQWKGLNLTRQVDSSQPETMNLRDVLYHVGWYEREMVEVLRLKTLAGSPWWELPLDERNANILAEGQEVLLVDAFQKEQQLYSELLGLLKGLTDEELENASFFTGMPSDWKPWEMIASNTYEHYPQHLEDIQNLRY
jgi:hypothetical protein